MGTIKTAFNFYLSEYIVKDQKDLSQPIYIIAVYLNDEFYGIRNYTINGNNDYQEIEKNFKSLSNKENKIKYKLIKIDLTTILDFEDVN